MRLKTFILSIIACLAFWAEASAQTSDSLIVGHLRREGVKFSHNNSVTLLMSGQEKFDAAKSLGWYDNLELTGKMHSVGWSHLIFDDRYSDIVDIYEGGYMHNRGVFRSEPNSCMNNDIPYYSTISRESIVKRIKAYAGENYSFEDFVKNDKRDAGIVESRVFGGNGDQRTAGTYQHAPMIHKGSPLKMAKVRRHR